MASSLLVIAAVVVLTVGASTGGGQAPAAQQHLFAFDDYSALEATRLIELDPTTLRRLPGRGLKLGDAARSRVLGPDGRTLAIGGSNYGAIIFVDLARLARTGVVNLARPTRDEFFEAEVVDWPRERRLLALVFQSQSAHSDSLPPLLVLVDPARHKVQRAIRLPDPVVAWARAAGRGPVFLLAPYGRVGAPRLAVVSSDGRIRTVALSRIPAGRGRAGRRPYGIAHSPALVADGRRAIVVGAFETAASVDLRTLAVSYHTVPRLMRPHLPVAPVSQTGSSGPELALYRQAFRLDRSRLIVTGTDKYPARGRKARWVTRAASIVDTDSWRVAHVFRNVARLESAHGLLFGSGESRANGMIGPSLAVFGRDGELVYRKDEPEPLWWELVAGRLFAGRPEGSALTELNPHTGETIRTLGRRADVWCCDVFAWTPGGAGPRHRGDRQ